MKRLLATLRSILALTGYAILAAIVLPVVAMAGAAIAVVTTEHKDIAETVFFYAADLSFYRLAINLANAV